MDYKGEKKKGKKNVSQSTLPFNISSSGNRYLIHRKFATNSSI